MNEIDDIRHEDTQQHLADRAAVELGNGPLADELAAEKRADYSHLPAAERVRIQNAVPFHLLHSAPGPGPSNVESKS